MCSLKDWGLGIRTGVGLGIPKLLFCSDTKAVSVSEKRPRHPKRRVVLVSKRSDEFVRIANHEWGFRYPNSLDTLVYVFLRIESVEQKVK